MESAFESLIAVPPDCNTSTGESEIITRLMSTIDELKKQLDHYKKEQNGTIAGMKKILIRGHSYNPNYAYRENEVAAIRLTGRWLNQAGFFPDDKLCVIPVNGLLVIFPDTGKGPI